MSEADDIVAFAEKVRTIRPNALVNSLDPAQINFVPPLNAAEQAAFDDIVAVTKSKTGLSVTDYNAVRTQMQQLRSTRQMTRNSFLALTTAQQMRILYDDDVAITEILLKLFRDV